MIKPACSVQNRKLFGIYFFDCCVSSNLWMIVSDILERNIGKDFDSVANLWIANKRHSVMNIVSSAVLWTIWKLRNDYLVGNEAGDTKAWKDAQKMVGDVQAETQGEIGGGDPTAGKQGQCDAADQGEARYIRVTSSVVTLNLREHGRGSLQDVVNHRFAGVCGNSLFS